MFGLKMGNQCSFGSVPPVALPTPVPFLLPTGFQMDILHGSGGENLVAAAARPACHPSMGLHVMSEAPSTLKALATELAVLFSRLNSGNFKRDILTEGPSALPHPFPCQDIFKDALCPPEIFLLHPDDVFFLRNCRSGWTRLCSGRFCWRWCWLLKPPGDPQDLFHILSLILRAHPPPAPGSSWSSGCLSL